MVNNPAEYEGWVETGEMLEDADTFPDNQIGTAYSRRFIHPNKPGRFMDVSVYAVVLENSALAAGFEYGIEEQISLMWCGDMEDPGSTEIWSRPEHRNIDGYPELRSVEEAQLEARQTLVRMDAGDLSWNGEPKS
jgi:hypothetical protein